MQSATFERWLPQPPDAVWQFVSNPENDSLWRQEITRVEAIHGPLAEPGSQYSETVMWEGVEANVTMGVTESVPASRVEVTAEDPGYHSTSLWTFEPQNGGTKLKLAFSLEAIGALRLVEPFMAAILNRWLDRDLDTLSQHIDGHAR